MAGLDGQDGAGCDEVVLVGDGRSSAEVGGDPDALEDTSQGDERGRVGGWERVLALGNGGRTESPSQEGDVGGSIVGNLFELLIEGVGKPAATKSAWV